MKHLLHSRPRLCRATRLAHLPHLARAIVAAAAMAAAGQPASAVIIGSHVINGDGTFTYHYEVDNSAGAFDVAAWALEFDFSSPDWNPIDVLSGGDVSVPNPGWLADVGIPVIGLSAQDFISIDPSSDILTGTIVGGFSFTSSFPPGTITYHEFSGLGDVISGTTVGPVIAVEDGHSRLATLAIAALAVGVMRLWGKDPLTRLRREKAG